MLPRTAYVKPVKCRFPNCGAQGVHGNVVVSFSDGHVQQVTDGGDGTAARVTADGVTIGWTVGTHYEGPNGVRFHNNILVLFRRGSTVARIMADRPIIENWELRPGGKEVVVQSRASHGPSSVQLFDVTSGALKQKFVGYEISSSSPDWARPFAEKTAAATTPVQTNQADLDSAEQESPHTPPPGSREREDILDALRQRFYSGDRVAAHRNAKRVLFKVDFLRVKADWAFTCVARVNASEQGIGKPRCSLLHCIGDRWVDQNCFGALRIYELDRTAENGVDRGRTMMQKIRRIFPNAPKDIFPDASPQKPSVTAPDTSAVDGGTSSAGTKLKGEELNRGPAIASGRTFDPATGDNQPKESAAQSSGSGKEFIVIGSVIQKLPEGLLVKSLTAGGTQQGMQLADGAVLLVDHPRYSDLFPSEFVNVTVVARDAGTYSYTTTHGASSIVRKLSYKSEYK